MRFAARLTLPARLAAAWILSLGPAAWIAAALLAAAALYLAAHDTITTAYAATTAYLADMGPLGWILASATTLTAIALAAAAALTSRRHNS